MSVLSGMASIVESKSSTDHVEENTAAEQIAQLADQEAKRLQLVAKAGNVKTLAEDLTKLRAAAHKIGEIFAVLSPTKLKRYRRLQRPDKSNADIQEEEEEFRATMDKMARIRGLTNYQMMTGLDIWREIADYIRYQRGLVDLYVDAERTGGKIVFKYVFFCFSISLFNGLEVIHIAIQQTHIVFLIVGCLSSTNNKPFNRRDCKSMGEVPDLEFVMFLWRQEELELLLESVWSTFGEEFNCCSDTTKLVRRVLQLKQA